ncbi:arginyltransferase [Thalassoroseus pseudoceratinae]|uniref:arginyltransferase n=1 Tax=Thalassoroseus pseudoceratinae TaxID=2713176 RepID=UPI00141DDA3D|nr:arginyltransferase [Thalassoroseus pseudoceratinae]
MPQPILELFRTVEPPRQCSYLPDETASLEYRVVGQISATEYESWLSRGWRRHGWHFFRPACPNCVKCQSLRVDVAAFQPTKSQRRTLKRNSDVRVVVQPASVSEEHLRLYNDWHADMHVRSGWRAEEIDARQYSESFLMGDWEFSQEFLYFRNDRLIGVGLVDVLADSLSSVYFYHDPEWRPNGPGTFTILQEIEYARAHGKRWVYLGYYIAECQSMAYKNRFGPHEILAWYPEADESPQWNRPADTDPEGPTDGTTSATRR